MNQAHDQYKQTEKEIYAIINHIKMDIMTDHAHDAEQCPNSWCFVGDLNKVKLLLMEACEVLGGNANNA